MRPLHSRTEGPQITHRIRARRSIDELVARVRRSGATGALTIRLDSGSRANDTIAVLNRFDVRYTIAVRCSSKGINDAVRAIPDAAWTPFEYTADGEAEVAEMRLHTGSGTKAVTRRLVARRTRFTDRHQLKLWPD